MNERFVELADQAGADIWGDQVMASRHFDIEKFAHLLMREIATVQITHQATMDLENKKMDDPAKELNYAVIEHFGVEE
jgi:hypothetical protein